MEASGDVLGVEEKNKFFDQSCPEIGPAVPLNKTFFLLLLCSYIFISSFIGSVPNPDEECGSCFLLISQELFT